MIFILCLLFELSNSSCATIGCSGSVSQTCLLYGSNAITLSACDPGTSCPIQSRSLSAYLSQLAISSLTCSSGSSNVDPCSLVNQTTGHYCCSNSNCKTSLCTLNICQGFNFNDLCQTDSDCSPNMYCDPSPYGNFGQCQDAFTIGKNCDFDNQCASGLGCSRGSCVYLLSLDIGTLTDQSAFCKTNFTNPAFTCDAIDVYVNGKIIQSPFKCNMGDTCVYKYRIAKTVYASQTCVCDGTGGNTGYCSSYVMYDQNIGETMNSYLSYSTSICSGDDASSTNPYTLFQCQSIDDVSFYNYLNSSQVLMNWGLYQSNVIDSCALDLGLFDPSFTVGKTIFISFASALLIFYVM